MLQIPSYATKSCGERSRVLNGSGLRCINTSMGLQFNYIVYMKKVSNGDLSAMSQIQSLMAQADSAGKKLANMRGDLNADCLKRYNAVYKKMSNAAMEMSGASAADKAQIKEMHKASDKAIDAVSCMESCQKISDPMGAAKCMQKCM